MVISFSILFIFDKLDEMLFSLFPIFDKLDEMLFSLFPIFPKLDEMLFSLFSIFPKVDEMLFSLFPIFDKSLNFSSYSLSFNKILDICIEFSISFSTNSIFLQYRSTIYI